MNERGTFTSFSPFSGRFLGLWLVYNAIGWVPFVGGIASLVNVLSMLWDADRQCWHDKAAGTVVVCAPRP